MGEIDVARVRQLLVDGPPITDGYRGVDVHLEGSDVVVVFRWHDDPNVYAVRLSPIDEADLLDDPTLWFMEELDTGLVRRAPRRAMPRWIELDLHGSHSYGRQSTYVSDVPLVDTGMWGIRLRGRWLWTRRRPPSPGSFIQRSGLAVAPAQRALRHGTLIGWSVLWSNTPAPLLLGHGAIGSAGRQNVAELLTFQLTAEADSDGELSLARSLLHDAAEAGYRRVTTVLEAPALNRLGFALDANTRVRYLDLDDPTQLRW